MNLSIQEIKERLNEKNIDVQSEWFQELHKDERKGVQKLLKQFQRKREQEVALRRAYEEMSIYEKELYAKGYQFVAGVDEVGRGPLAGPVVAASVILPVGCYIPKLNDSKKLSEKVREELYNIIAREAVAIGVGVVSAREIDEINIYQATKKAMRLAISQLPVTPDYLLIDALQLEGVPIPQKSIVQGDAKSISIAASSIIAKVTRDRLMKQMAQRYPQYGFDQHMGYGTKKHLEALDVYGICPEHRLSFAPIKERITNLS
jgi:ribonuclease HII